MNDLTVFNRGGQLYTDSHDVAKMVGKQHKNLIRDIARYTETMKKSTERKIASIDLHGCSVNLCTILYVNFGQHTIDDLAKCDPILI